jgi:hypothetical protein
MMSATRFPPKGELEGWTQVKLRQMLSQLGLKAGGSKNAQVNRLDTFYKEAQTSAQL